MSEKAIFEILLLIARPGAGKSEIIAFLKNLPLDERIERFHIGKIEEIDDFPMLWTWFEEDALLEEMGKPRLHTDEEGYFLWQHLWDLLIERISLEYTKKQRDIPDLAERYTTLLEFSRGMEHGGYRSAFAHLSAEILNKIAILYVDVTWEESLRKNRKRFNPEKPDSILEHGMPDEKLERLYRETDWPEISQEDPAFLNLPGVRVPYVVFDNADDVTTRGGQALAKRLEETLNRLWGQHQNQP